MPIITISSSSQKNRQIIAERVAERLGHTCISREIILEASEHYNVPEIKLAKAIHDSPTIFERLSNGKERYLSFFKASLLNNLKNGSIVYHGIVGHFFVQGIPRVLKVRILDSMENRIQEDMELEGVPEGVARKRVLQEDRERYNWCSALYKMDTRDPELYNLVINIERISIDDCVDLICYALEKEYFKETAEAEKILKNQALTATIKAAIVQKYSDATVTSYDGNVVIHMDPPISQIPKKKRDIRALTCNIDGIRKMELDLKAKTLPRTPMHK
ncbi:AAA family ATPase [Desulfoluna sp.]|uniref:cytidylate kinase-like family protein n=1 Tax=Desulfoluna sp. TaxID=2045199 RepID=UPI00261AAEB3|nr:cytidylate kinase-like family protein [Desulfoluna sp.]